MVIEDCKVYQADFCGLGLGGSKDCAVRRCDLSHNGNTGLGMGGCQDCTIEGCTLLFNNYRRFYAGWHCGGMKCIPGNRRCTIRDCEAAYNIASDGIWFDTDNADIRILGNVCHHNGGCGIFFEINKGGGIIADNLVYANRGRGIYISGSQNTWVVHNTVAAQRLRHRGHAPRRRLAAPGRPRPQQPAAPQHHQRPPPCRGAADLTLYMGCQGDSPSAAPSRATLRLTTSTPTPPGRRRCGTPGTPTTRWPSGGSGSARTAIRVRCPSPSRSAAPPSSSSPATASTAPPRCPPSFVDAGHPRPGRRVR